MRKRFYIAPSTIQGAGDGLFAGRRIARGAIIGEYTGETLTLAQAQRRADVSYQIEVQAPDGRVWVIDGKRRGNAMRTINHACYADEQNAKFTLVGGRVWVQALRDIATDEEILVSYGRDYSAKLCLPRYLGELALGQLDYEQFVDICTRAGVSRRECGKMARAVQSG